MQPTETPRARRVAAGLSQMEAAVRAGVSIPTLRLYEANPESVGADARGALDKAYAAMTPKGKD